MSRNRQESAPGLLFSFPEPEEPGPPLEFGTFGASLLSPAWTGGALMIGGFEESEHPTDNTPPNPAKIVHTTIDLTRMEVIS